MKFDKELGPLWERLREWADVREDEGIPTDVEMKKLTGIIRKLASKFENASPSSAVLKNEPNSLPAIAALRTGRPGPLWKEFDGDLYAEKVAGAYLARAAGCTLGAIVEGSSLEHMEAVARHCRMKMPPTDYWTFTPHPWARRYDLSPCADYLRQNLSHVPVDDDVTYTVLGMLILEDHGIDFTTADVGKAWLKYLPTACTAERVALDNLRKKVSWKQCGLKNNPYIEWIGADIRSDPWGYAAPAWPRKAAEMAYRDAYISHRFGGIYGEMYFSAVIAAAFAVSDPLEACEIGLGEIPPASRAYRGIRWALDTAHKVRDYRHANALVSEKFAGMHHVHTINNAALTIFALALGGRDVTKVIGNAVAMGYDNDCTAATAGSIVGAAVGASAVPEHWCKPFANKTRTYMIGQEWFRNTDIVKRFGRIARAVWTCATPTQSGRK